MRPVPIHFAEADMPEVNIQQEYPDLPAKYYRSNVFCVSGNPSCGLLEVRYLDERGCATVGITLPYARLPEMIEALQVLMHEHISNKPDGSN